LSVAVTVTVPVRAEPVVLAAAVTMNEFVPLTLAAVSQDVLLLITVHDVAFVAINNVVLPPAAGAAQDVALRVIPGAASAAGMNPAISAMTSRKDNRVFAVFIVVLSFNYSLFGIVWQGFSLGYASLPKAV
jgi:hypothetical protein